MGLYDHYDPIPEIACPNCSSSLHGWQGKDAACALFLWRQEHPHPVDQTIDDDTRIPPSRYAEFSLPQTFCFYTSCSECGVWINCTGFCDASRIWRFNCFGDHTSDIPIPAAQLDDGWRLCSACSDAWQPSFDSPYSVCPSCNVLTQVECHPTPHAR